MAADQHFLSLLKPLPRPTSFNVECGHAYSGAWGRDGEIVGGKSRLPHLLQNSLACQKQQQQHQLAAAMATSQATES